MEIAIELFLCINVFIQAFWLYIYMRDRKNNNKKILAEISNQNLEIISKLETIRINTYNTSKNTYNNF